MKRLLWASAAVLLAAALLPRPVLAAGSDIVLAPTLDAAEFKTFVEEIGIAVAYNPVAPAEPRGITGVDVGLSVTLVDIDSTIWDEAVSDTDAPSSLPVPRLHAQKGLPFGIDIGLSLIQVPSSDVSVLGGEVRKAILEGGVATPAVSVGVHYSRLNGVDELDLTSWGVGIGVSKGFAIFTPYAAVDQVWIKGEENSAAVTLADVSESVTRTQVGLKMALLPIMNIVAQADFAVANSYTLRVNVGF